MLGRVKLENTLLTCDIGNFNEITARSRNQTLVTVMRDPCTTTVQPAPPITKMWDKATNEQTDRRTTSFSLLNFPKQLTMMLL